MRRSLSAAVVAAVIGIGVSAGVVYSQDGGSGGGEQPPAGGEQGGGEVPGMSAEDMAAWQKYMTPGPEHERMSAMAGTWDVTGRFWMAPEGPATETKGSAKFRMILGGRIQVQEYTGEMMGMPFEGFGLSGFDNGTKQHFGTWADSMGTGMMSWAGAADAQGVITATGNFTDPSAKLYRTRTVTTVKDADAFRMEMHIAGPDHPVEFKMMELEYTRRK